MKLARVQLQMKENLLKRIDEQAERYGLSRSAFIRFSLTQTIKRNEN